MMRFVAWLVGLAAVAVLAFAFAPASLIAPRIEAASHGGLRLVEPEGRAWNGSALLASRDGRARLPVAWRLAPTSLLRGEAQVQFVAPGALRANVVARDATLEARDVDAAFPLALLSLPPGVEAGGDVRVASDLMVLRPDRHEGRARVEWQRARLSMPGVPSLDLGTVTATLAADGTRWRGPVQARGGNVLVDGEAIVDANGADLALRLTPQAGAEFLRGLGAPDAQGAIALRFAPRFR